MAPNSYTELFFLDEAVALAAGHRPCFQCQRDRFQDFAKSLTRGRDGSPTPVPSASEVDRRLHADRTTDGRVQKVFPASFERLPDGVFVQLPGDASRCWLIVGGNLSLWSHQGYVERRPNPRHAEVSVLTPLLAVKAIAHGYKPIIHPSAYASPVPLSADGGVENPAATGPHQPARVSSDRTQATQPDDSTATP
jgi:hypothetical protein